MNDKCDRIPEYWLLDLKADGSLGIIASANWTEENGQFVMASICLRYNGNLQISCVVNFASCEIWWNRFCLTKKAEMKKERQGADAQNWPKRVSLPVNHSVIFWPQYFSQSKTVQPVRHVEQITVQHSSAASKLISALVHLGQEMGSGATVGHLSFAKSFPSSSINAKSFPSSSPKRFLFVSRIITMQSSTPKAVPGLHGTELE